MERECERPHRRSRTTDGYDVPDAYDATTPIFRRSTAAVSNVKCMTGSTAPGGCRCRLSVEGEGARPASDQPYLILKAGAPIDGDPRRRHARDPFTVRQGTTLMMITLMRTNRTAVGPARRWYSTIRGGGRGGGADWGFDSIWRRLEDRAWVAFARPAKSRVGQGWSGEPRTQKRTKEQCSAWSHGLS
jgi:hypothetical protein